MLKITNFKNQGISTKANFIFAGIESKASNFKKLISPGPFHKSNSIHNTPENHIHKKNKQIMICIFF